MAAGWRGAELRLVGAGGEPADLRRTLDSHGLTSLAPFRLEETVPALEATLPQRRGAPRTVRISPGRAGYARVELFGPAVSDTERERAMEILDFLGITRLAHEVTGNLSYGQKKLMDFGALLMSEPKIILLDEPASGVNRRLLDDITEHIRVLNERGMTVFIVEHNMDVVMSLSHKVVVMAFGQIIAEGKPEEVQRDPAVLEAYLGGAEAAKAAGNA